MRGMGQVVIWALVCVAAFALYFFVGKAQLNKKMDIIRGEMTTLNQRLEETKQMEQLIPEMVGEMPRWRQQMAMLKQAIPAQLDDQIFLANLARLLDKHGAKLLAVELVQSGPWLSGLKESDFKILESRGVDLDTARRIQAALYSITLRGDFTAILQAFEELKGYNRIYTIDQVLGPALGQSGMITETIDFAQTPIRITGRLFFGVPENYADLAKLDEMIQRIVVTPVARQVQQQITESGQRLLEGGLDLLNHAAADAPDGQSAAGDDPTKVQAVSTAAGGEGSAP